MTNVSYFLGGNTGPSTSTISGTGWTGNSIGYDVYGNSTTDWHFNPPDSGNVTYPDVTTATFAAAPVSLFSMSGYPGQVWFLNSAGLLEQKTLYDDVPSSAESQFIAGANDDAATGPNDTGYALTANGLWANNRAFDIGDLMDEADSEDYGDMTPVAIAGNTGLIAGQLDDASVGVPMEQAPAVLRVNSAYNKQNIDSSTGYAISDCNVANLTIARGAKAGKICVTNLHNNFFGINPNTFPPSFYDGANVTIQTLAVNDTETGLPQTGQIAMYVTKNLGSSSEQFWQIPLTVTSGNTTVPNNLVPVLYSSNSTIPRGAGVQYWMEGTAPGNSAVLRVTLRTLLITLTAGCGSILARIPFGIAGLLPVPRADRLTLTTALRRGLRYLVSIIFTQVNQSYGESK